MELSKDEKETIEVLKNIYNLKWVCSKCAKPSREFCTGCTEETKENVLTIIEKQQKEIVLKDKVIDEIKKEIREHIGFENLLKREGREPDLFNQGRFYVADNIKDILNKVKEAQE